MLRFGDYLTETGGDKLPGMTELAGDVWLHCSACRKGIPFGATHWVCSVSTCNRARTQLVFCSVSCWDSHVATLRHRDSWAIEARAPTRDEAAAGRGSSVNDYPEASPDLARLGDTDSAARPAGREHGVLMRRRRQRRGGRRRPSVASTGEPARRVIAPVSRSTAKRRASPPGAGPLGVFRARGIDRRVQDEEIHPGAVGHEHLGRHRGGAERARSRGLR